MKAPQTLISAGDTWQYLDSGADLGSAWQTNVLDSNTWLIGQGQFGYGDGDEQTQIGYGPDIAAKYITTYFRKSFAVTNLPPSFRLELKILCNDGAAVFLNGALVTVVNLSSNATSLTPATAPQDNLKDTWFTIPVNPTFLLPGTNTLAVEVHLSDGTRPYLSFDTQLISIETKPIRITSITPLAGGQFQLRVESELPELSVHATENWTDWSVLGNVTLTNGAGVFITPQNVYFSHRYYRLRSP